MVLVYTDSIENEEAIARILHQQSAELTASPPIKDTFSICAIENEQWLGGLTASLFGNTLHLSMLGVAKEFRGKKIGSRLIERLEEIAHQHNCLYMTVNTQDYQAKSFYEGHGFSVFAHLADTPFTGTTKFYLKKKLV